MAGLAPWGAVSTVQAETATASNDDVSVTATGEGVLAVQREGMHFNVIVSDKTQPVTVGLTARSGGRLVEPPSGSSQLSFTYRVEFPLNPGEDSAIGMVLRVFAFDLDVNNDTKLGHEYDGVANYLPGYRISQNGYEPVLSTGTKFREAKYQGQAMTLVLQGIGAESGVEEVIFEIISTTSFPGFCGNATHESIEGDESGDDYSFRETENADSITIKPNSEPASAEHVGKFEDDRVWTRFWAKDYGGQCVVNATAKAGGEVLFTCSIRIPVDTQGIADIYLAMQEAQWEADYNWGNAPLWPGENLTAEFDEEPKNPDGLPGDHITTGEGLTLFEEYRGFILDYGPGHTEGGHKRLSVARKELLVQTTEMANKCPETGLITDLIKDTIKKGENPAVSEAYNRQDMYQAVTDLYRHPGHGAGIDVYWVHVPLLEYERAVSYDGAHERNHAYLHTGTSTKYESVEILDGGSYIKVDYRLAKGNEDEKLLFNELFRCSENYLGPARHFENTREPLLEQFVKLLLVNRWGWVANSSQNPPHKYHVPVTGPARIQGTAPYHRQGALVAVAGIAEEGTYINDGDDNHYTGAEFIGMLHWAVAHELAHLLVGTIHPGGDATATTALISDGSPRREGISITRVNEAERKAMDVRNKLSVPPLP